MGDYLGDWMADRGENRLTQISIKRAGDGKAFDGGGLILAKSGDSGKWVYRYSHLKKRREMGLGSWPTLGLAEARRLRNKWREVLLEGNDPIEIRRQEEADQIAERDKSDPTFKDLTLMVFEARKAGLRGGGKRGRWLSPFEIHLFPKIGHKRVSTLTQEDLRDALKAIWQTKWPTAEKAFQRTKIVLTEGMFLGYSCDPITLERAKRLLGNFTKDCPTQPAGPVCAS